MRLCGCAIENKLLLFREVGGGIYGPYERRTEEDSYLGQLIKTEFSDLVGSI